MVYAAPAGAGAHHMTRQIGQDSLLDTGSKTQCNTTWHWVLTNATVAPAAAGPAPTICPSSISLQCEQVLLLPNCCCYLCYVV